MKSVHCFFLYLTVYMKQLFSVLKEKVKFRNRCSCGIFNGKMCQTLAGAEGFEFCVSFPATFASARKLRRIGKLWEVTANCLRLLFICFCNINGQITDRFMALLHLQPHFSLMGNAAFFTFIISLLQAYVKCVLYYIVFLFNNGNTFFPFSTDTTSHVSNKNT